jgi:hypothetical protein
VIECNINGTDGRFVFDTGTTESYGDVDAKGLGIQGYGLTLHNGKRRPVWIYKLNKIRYCRIKHEIMDDKSF